MKILMSKTNVPEWVCAEESGFDPEVMIVDAPEVTDDEWLVMTLSRVYAEITGTAMEEDGGIIVLKNGSGRFGAAAVLDEAIRRKVLEWFDADAVYILPSSIHEVMAIPLEGDPEQLAEMVKHINMTEVSPEDVLSDHVYKMTSAGLEVVA